MNHNPYRAYWEKAQEQSLKLAQYYTPECLVELCIELLQPKGELFDPCCGLGSFLLKAKSKDPDLKISGNDIAKDLGELPFEFTNSDYLNSEDKEYDYIIANIPFNLKKTHCQLVDENYCWIEKIIKNTRKKALIILPNMVNSRHNPKILAKRKQIVENRVLELIIQLPSHLFTKTAIGPCLWIINKEKDQKDLYFLYAARERFSTKENNKKQRTLTDENVREICNKENWVLGTYEKIKEHDYCLMPGVYDENDDKPQETEEEIKAKIKTLAKEIRGIHENLKKSQDWFDKLLKDLENHGELLD